MTRLLMNQFNQTSGCRRHAACGAREIQRQIAQFIKSQIKTFPVNAGPNMAFKHAFHLQLIWLQTFGCNLSESCQQSFPSFCAPPCKVTVLFHSNLSRGPFLGQVFDLDMQLCTGFDLDHADLFFCHIFPQRPMNVVQSQLFANSIKMVTCHCPKFIKH